MKYAMLLVLVLCSCSQSVKDKLVSKPREIKIEARFKAGDCIQDNETVCERWEKDCASVDLILEVGRSGYFATNYHHHDSANHLMGFTYPIYLADQFNSIVACDTTLTKFYTAYTKTKQ